ncbi:MAG: type II toxin-antitoxin system RelE/ParE family toxin [Syntrophobacteraceae bacterium]|jgi:mRNA-degrading endonuclease RelE of RelBE toxin-antitoxin system
MPVWWRNWTLKVYETVKFQKQRKKLRSDSEKTALKGALRSVAEDPLSGKKLKGEFKDFRSLRYFAEGQERRIIYKIEENTIYLLSFGPREGIYK